MAAIDKTYVNKREYKEVLEFLSSDVYEKMKNEIGFTVKPYKHLMKDFGKDGEKELPLWNTPTLFDMWLAKNCKLEFIQNRLHEQYSDTWIGWEDLDFSKKGFLIKAKYKDSSIFPWKQINDNEMEVFEDLLVYGTTYVDKFIYTVYAIIRGESYNIEIGDSFPLIVEFDLFGLHVKAVSTIFETKYYVVDDVELPMDSDREIDYAYFPDAYSRDPFAYVFQMLTIKRSIKKSDFLKFEPEQIILSQEDECYSVDAYENFDPKKYKRYFHELPKYILSQLKD